jgi:hypothetical protein
MEKCNIEGVFHSDDYNEAQQDAYYTDKQETNTLLINPDSRGSGAYLKLISGGEKFLGEIDIAPQFKLAISLFYVHKKENFNGIKIIKLQYCKKHDWKITGFIKFNYVEREHLQQILSILTNISVDKKVNKSRIDLGNLEDISQITTLLENIDSLKIQKIAHALGQNPSLHQDIIALRHKRDVLKKFEEMLSQDLKEPEWQDFFQKNQWIFGYGLQYRFQGILQREAHISDSNLDGTGEVISDFLISDQRFVTFVEIKRPDTLLFKNKPNRNKAWGLTSDLFDAASQILQQKAEGEYKFKDRSLYDDKNNRVESKPYDSKAILLIGNLKKELESAANDVEKSVKLETFERFRRDSRNIEIITYDELYDRTKHIIASLDEKAELEQ